MSAIDHAETIRPAVKRPSGWLRFVALNVLLYLAIALGGAIAGSTVAYLFTDFGSSPGPVIATIAGGAVFLLAAFVALGLPIAGGVLVVAGLLMARRDLSRAAIIGIATTGGVVWLGFLFLPISVAERPAELILVAPWLVFGLLLRRRPRGIRRR